MTIPATKKRKLQPPSAAFKTRDTQAVYPGPGAGTRQENGLDLDIYNVPGQADGSRTFEEGSSHGSNALSDGIKGGEEPTEKSGSQHASFAPVRTKRDMSEHAFAYNNETFRSNLFKLQTEDLLARTKLPYSKDERTGQLLRRLKYAIEQIPPREPQLAADVESISTESGKIVVPFPHPKPAIDAKYKVEYQRPANVNVVGSYALRTVTKKPSGDGQFGYSIDVAVTMPSALFHDKDYLNHRYPHKRAYYLACIAAGIQEWVAQEQLSLCYMLMHGNSLQPIIVLKDTAVPDTCNQTSWEIRIIPALPTNQFPTGKLLPEKNALRLSANDQAKASHFYNASIMMDSLFASYLTLQLKASQRCEAFQDACILGHIWLNNRGFGSAISKGGFGKFEFGAIMALLLETNASAEVPSFSTRYSSYQLFKATLQIMASRDVVRQPLVLGAESLPVGKAVPHPMIYDSFRGINILFKMTIWSYTRLKQDAMATVQALKDTLFDQFDPTFLQSSIGKFDRYDVLLQVPTEELLKCVEGPDPESKLSNGCKKLYTVLTQGLGNRVKLLDVQAPEVYENPWSLNQHAATDTAGTTVLIGLRIETVNASRTVDHGPLAEDRKQAAKFRQFWGDKAELRRFKDGSVMESIIWSSKAHDRPVLEQIIVYVLGQHFRKELADAANFTGTDLRLFLPPSCHLDPADMVHFQPANNAFDTFEKDIRNLEGLPLLVKSILPADPQLRYASVVVPFSDDRLPMEPANAVLDLEGSGRWPDDLLAIQRTKIAFLIKLSDLLQTSVKDITCRLGLENPKRPLENQGFLDVIYPSGAAFRIRIHHERETFLLQRRLKDPQLDGHSKQCAAMALATHKEMFSQIPSHTQALRALATRYPALSPSIRLTKRWFASHLLSCYVADPLIELIVLRTFLHPSPFGPPSSAHTAFLRTIAWLSRWDWRKDPLIVDVTESLSQREVKDIETHFLAWRRIDPSMNRVVLFAATQHDVEGTTWTDHAKPPKVVAARMTALAKAAVAEVQLEVPDFGALFQEDYRIYDFVVYLDAKAIRKANGSERDTEVERYKNLNIDMGVMGSGMLGFRPALLFLEDLQRIFSDVAVLFHDGDVGNVIAGLWTPGNEGRHWRIGLGWSTVPHSLLLEATGAEPQSTVNPNRAAIVDEIARLGGNLVRKIQINRL